MATFNVKSHNPRPELVFLRIDGSAVATSASTAGVLEGTTLVTAAKGTGGTSNEVTITLNNASARVPVVLGVASITTNCHVEVKSVAVGSIVFETFQVADGTTGVDDADWHACFVVFKNSGQLE
jgi:hypothetical protein